MKSKALTSLSQKVVKKYKSLKKKIKLLFKRFVKFIKFYLKELKAHPFKVLVISGAAILKESIVILLITWISLGVTIDVVKRVSPEDSWINNYGDSSKHKYRIEYVFPTLGAKYVGVEDEILIEVDELRDWTWDIEIGGIELLDFEGNFVECDFNFDREENLVIVDPKSSLEGGRDYTVDLKKDVFENGFEYTFETERAHDEVITNPEADSNGNHVIYKKSSFYLLFNYGIDSLEGLEKEKWLSYEEVKPVLGVEIDEKFKPEFYVISNKALKIHFFNTPETREFTSLTLDRNKLKSGDRNYSGKTNFNIALGKEIDSITLAKNNYLREGSKKKAVMFVAPKHNVNKVVVTDGRGKNVDVKFSNQLYDTAEVNVLYDFTIDETLYPKVKRISVEPTDNWGFYTDFDSSVTVKLLNSSGVTLDTQEFIVLEKFKVRVEDMYKEGDTFIADQDSYFAFTGEVNPAVLSNSIDFYVNGSKVDSSKYLNLYFSNIYLKDKEFDDKATYRIVFSGEIISERGVKIEKGKDIAFKYKPKKYSNSIDLYLPDPIAYFRDNESIRFGAEILNYESVNLELFSCEDMVKCKDYLTVDILTEGYLDLDDSLNKVDSRSFSQPEDYFNKDYYRIVDFGTQDKGIYVLRTKNGEGKVIGTRYIVVSNVNLMARRSRSQISLWAVDTITREPQEGMEVSCYSGDEEKVDSVLDKNGYSLLASEKDLDFRNFLCFGLSGDDVALVYPDMDSLDYDESYSAPKISAALITDRKAYNNDDKVQYKLIVRNRDGSLLEGNYYTLTFIDYKNQYYGEDGSDKENLEFKHEGSLSEFGTVSGVIEYNNLRGYQTVETLVFNEDGEYMGGAYRDIYVTQINKSPFTVSSQFISDKKTEDGVSYYSDGDRVSLEVFPESYSLGSDSYNVNVTVTAQSSSYSASQFAPYDGLSIADYDYLESAVIFKGATKVDEYGKASFEFIIKEQFDGPITLSAEIEVVNSISESVWSYDAAYLLPNALLWSESNWGPYNFVVTSGGDIVKNRDIKVRILYHEINSYYEEIDGALVWKTQLKKKKYKDIWVTADSRGYIKIDDEVFKDRGDYTLYFDVSGYELAGEIYFYRGNTSGYTYEPSLGRLYNQAKFESNYADVELKGGFSNKVSVGEKRDLVVKLPDSSYKGVVTVERDGKVLDSFMVKSSNGEINQKLDIKDAYFPNVYVTFYLLGDNENSFPISYIAKQDLVVEKDIDLGINLSLDKDQYSPGDEVKLVIDNKENKYSEYMVVAVDKAVLDLAVRDELDFYSELYGPYKYYDNFTTWDIVSHLAEKYNVEVWDLLSEEVVSTKGGGSGGSMQDESIFRKDFSYIGYFEPSAISDERGKYSGQFTLPDSATTWNIMVIGVTKDGHMGRVNKDFVSKKGVFLQLSVPDTLYSEDKYSMPVILQNTTSSSQSGVLELATGCDSNSLTSNVQNLTVEKHSSVSHTVKLNACADSANGGTLIVKAQFRKNGDIFDSVKREIRVLPTQQDVRVSSTFTGKTLGYEPSGEVIGKPAEFEVVVGGDPRTYISESIANLYNYPYKCSEQAASQIKALLWDEKFNHIGSERRDIYIKENLSIIYRNQNSDGGLGFWEYSSSSPHVSAIVYSSLKRLEDANYEVKSKVVDDLKNYLLNKLDNHSVGDDIYIYILATLSEVGEDISEYESELDSLENQADSVIQYNLLARIYYRLAEQGDKSFLNLPGAYTKKYENMMDKIMLYSLEDDNGRYFIYNNSYFYNASTSYTNTVESLKTIALTDYDKVDPQEILNWIMANKVSVTYSDVVFADALYNLYSESKVNVSGIEVTGEGNMELVVENEFYNVYRLKIDKVQDKSYSFDITSDDSVMGLLNIKFKNDFDKIDSSYKNVIIDKEVYTSKGQLVTTNELVAGSYYTVRVVYLGNDPMSGFLVADGITSGVKFVDYNLDTTKDLGKTDTSMGVFIDADKVMFYDGYVSDSGVFNYDIRAVSPGEYSHSLLTSESMYNPNYHGLVKHDKVTVR